MKNIKKIELLQNKEEIFLGTGISQSNFFILKAEF